MLKNLFKKKLTVREASAALVSTILEACKTEWDEDYKLLKPYLNDNLTEQELEYIPFEIALAIASMELQVARNLSPDIATEVYENVLVLMAYDEWKDYVIEAISMEYMPYMQKSIRNNENPLEEVCRILSNKIGFNLDVLSATVLMSVIATKIQYWKFITQNYKVVKN
ncbi:hypothetical protein AB7942_30200 [Neobacillus sp. BF23-41]|uniref:hypothetical protein n=1 Tax=Neobacillus sp. BF23-41 TaxID=3240280 RepID=UPI0034E45A38